MKFLASALAAVAMLLTASAAAAQTGVGDWTGLLAPTPATTFRLAVHIQKSGGGLSGTLDDQSRGAYGLPLTDVTLSGDALSFKILIAAAPATFTGKWDAGAGRWVGQWSQGPQSFALTFAPGVWPPEPRIDGLDGIWDGMLTSPGGQLRIVLHVRTGARGTSAWIDSPDQHAGGLDVTALKRDGADFSFAMPVLKAEFAGKVGADGQSIPGIFTQAGALLPLTLARRAVGASAPPPPPPPNRPQTPKPPFPYAAQDVSFDGGVDGVKLAGTLTLPPGAGRFPAVVLVSGSGPNTRDETVADHQIFLVLADYLSRHGLAVLRYDKRGVGKSTGDYAHATTADFADDAVAAVAYLRTRPEIAAARIGLIGHSEGGEIVPIVAVRDPKVAFIVMMAGPGVSGAEILPEQGRLIGKAGGMSDAKLAESDAQLRKLIAIVERDKDPAVAKTEMVAEMSRFAAAHGDPPPAAAGMQADGINSAWFRYFFEYDPAPTLRKLRGPVLAVNGSKDLQVPPAQNLPPIRAALAHDRDATVEELPGLNHLFQPATTGSPAEYRTIETTIDPAALALITGWILKYDGAARPT
jgi:hypothetical protein